MNIEIFSIPKEQDEWAVIRALEQRIHEDSDPARKVNFKVKLNPNTVAGVGHNGTGTLTLPSQPLGRRFLDQIRDSPVKMAVRDANPQKLRFKKSNKRPPDYLIKTLDKTPFVSPDVEEKHAKILADLEAGVPVESLQLGLYYRPLGSKGRAFSIEWPAREYTEDAATSKLKFEYDRKLIRITLGDLMTDLQGHTIAINIASINRIGVGHDFSKPYACFDTSTPPVFERIDFYGPYKSMRASLDQAHEIVAPYATQTRIVLFDARQPGREPLEEFKRLCKRAGIPSSRIISCDVLATRERMFCSENKIPQLRRTIGELPWPAAFQMEALLHNGFLHPENIKDLLPLVKRLCLQHQRDGSIYVGELLRTYRQVLQSNNVPEDPIGRVFQDVLRTFLLPSNAGSSSDSTIRCGHVTFTPTRMVLEGPYPTQSNRIIRMYSDYADHFIRVDFRDEDRLKYRWDRSVDPTDFLRCRVGGILKHGFFLGGRHFEFLGYSNSGLKEHEVWFMSPINHFRTTTGEIVRIDGQYIRDQIGDFRGTPLMKQPSKYAARIAQAFTSTESSTSIDRAEWEEVEDLGREPYLFTDGVGTISKDLGDRIWKELCKDGTGSNRIQPSAYQIRFLGYKGVVSVDREMDNLNEQKQPEEPRIHMKLRPSMKKFDNSRMEKADIEIAQSFCAPNACYLNRPLVMLLEDLGVKKETFEKLQDDAIADSMTLDNSMEQFCQFMSRHKLGGPFRLPELLRRLCDLGLDIRPPQEAASIDTPFLRLLRSVAIKDVLRDIRHKARIPIPGSYLLVGVADEGVAWQKTGRKDVVTLSEGEIYACVQKPGDKEPTWIEGSCAICRSPVVHPGDVQRVYAIGKPSDEGLCAFRDLVNVVVLPSVGDRSLASCLGGGDVDGDTFAIITDSSLLPDCQEEPASYLPVDTYTLPDGKESTVEDICDFFVQYINSDVLGLLCDLQLTIADQLTGGLKNDSCRELAALCSQVTMPMAFHVSGTHVEQAVDYPKQGNPVDMGKIEIPRTPIRCKPDWHSLRVVSDEENTDYYRSTRALGHLCRSEFLRSLDITEEDKKLSPSAFKPLADPISKRLMPFVRSHLGANANPTGEFSDSEIFRRYVQELDYICLAHSLSNNSRGKLIEAEVVAGAILEESSLKSLRKARVHRMRTHSGDLARGVQIQLQGKVLDTDEAKLAGLERAWRAWEFSQRSSAEHGSNSFGIIALGAVFDCLEKLGTLS